MKKRWKCMVCGQIFEGDAPPVPCPICGAGEDAFVPLPGEPEILYRKDTHEHFVLIGGGVAALEAAKAIRARNRTCRIQLIAGEGVIPYNRPALSDVLADGYSFEAIALMPYAEYAQNRIELIMSGAAGIDARARQVRLSNGQSLPYDALLIATGAKAFNPIARDEGAIPGFTLRAFADVDLIREATLGRRALIVGGGILGLEAALALMELGASVTVVELSARVLSLQADEQGSARIQAALEQRGVRVKTSASVARLTPGGALLTDGGQIDADCALISIGIRSELALAKQANLAQNRGILVDAHMRASEPGMFAAGDCAEFQGRVMGLWAAAALQGQVAGANMAGDDAQYAQIVPATAFEVGALQMFSAGALSGGAHLSYQDKDVYRRLYFDQGRLAGVMFVGDVSMSGQALSMIERGAKPEEARALLG